MLADQAVPMMNGELRLRRAELRDIDQLVELHERAYLGASDLAADRAQLIDLLTKPHPTFDGTNMSVVVDISVDRIVSSAHLSDQRWRVGDDVIDVGEVEHVSTDPAYERRGLVRTQIELAHEWSRERGHVLTAINGIPWLYTKFGYELTLPKWTGRRFLHAARGTVPALTVRPARFDDLGFVDGLYRESQRRWFVTTERSTHAWEYELVERGPSQWRRNISIIEADSQPIGFVSFDSSTGHVECAELVVGRSWVDVLGSVAEQVGAACEGKQMSWEWITDHPAYAVADMFAEPSSFAVPGRRAAWYTRIPDMVAFVNATSHRLSSSSDEIDQGATVTINRFDLPGLKLLLDGGKIVAEPWVPVDLYDGDAAFADQTMDHLVLGNRSIDELERMFPYRVRTNGTAHRFLASLFPSRPSQLLPVY